jgi:uncharacterized protein involved in exopolysaccharide biosynthesis
MVAVSEYSPIDTFQNILNRWWWVVLFALIGGGIGWVVHRLQPPVYEATAVLTVMIDYTQTAPLTEYDQDHAIGIVKAVILSKEVIDQVITKAQSQQIQIEELNNEHTIFLDRKHSVLELTARDPNPQIAATLANLWAETAYGALVEAQHNAVQARILRGQLVALEKCLQLPETSPDTPAVCRNYPSEDLPDRIQVLASEVQNAEIGSKGIISPLLFEVSERADLPARPVAYGANWLIFSGAMIGFVLGIFGISVKGKER